MRSKTNGRGRAGLLFAVFYLCSLSASRRAAAEIHLLDAEGWTLSVDGRFNTFASYGWGDSYPQDPANQSYNIVVGGGLNQHLQGTADGTFTTSRIRSGFLGNIIGFKVRRMLTESTSLTGYMGIWSSIQTNLTRYLPIVMDVREGYMKLEGPWGSLLAGRALGLYSRGSVEIDFNYAHANGLGYPCDLDGPNPTCGQIGFGVIFPFYAPTIMYATPSLGGFTVTAGLFDPAILPGHWERVILPRAEGEAAFERKFGSLGMFKLFASGIWQRIGLNSQKGDTNPNARKTVDVVGFAGGGRLELGPLRLGLAAHQGKGVGFYYAIENSPAAYYFSPNGNSDPNDGNLRTFSGYYGQAMLVFGKVDIAAGYGVAQLHYLPYEDILKDLPRAQKGINAGLFVHITPHLVWGVDFFRGMFSWQRGETQNVNFVNTGLTAAF